VLFPEHDAVFDYGCGSGDDLRHMAAIGVYTGGWDPTR